jgi:hypothetical protein
VARLSARQVVWRALQVPLLFLGVFMAGLVADSNLSLLPTFLSPRYANLWDDLVAHHTRAPGHKSLAELDDAYGSEIVHRFVIVKHSYPALVPSEKAALASWLNMAIEGDGGAARVGTEWVGRTTLLFALFYFPFLVALNALAKNFTWAFCRTPRAGHTFLTHFEPHWRGRLIGAAASLPAVVLLALWNAYGTLTPDLGRLGFNLFNLTVLFVLLAYFSGLGLRFVRSVIEGVFIVRGTDPGRIVWDELLTVALTTPVLLFVYRNSAVSVLTDVVAGLGPLVIAKLVGWSLDRGRAGAAVPVATRAGAADLSGNRWLAITGAAVGAVYALGCGCAPVVVPEQREPTRLTVAELEAKGKHRDARWLELTEGYLFWPKLVASHTGAGDPEWYFVPLVSKEVLDEWLAAYRKDGPRTEYSFDRCTAIVRFYPREFGQLFPGVAPGRFDPETPFEPYTFNGDSQQLFNIAHGLPDELAAGTDDFEPGRLIRLDPGRPEFGARPMLLMAALGVVFMLPLGIRWLRSGLTTRPAAEEPLEVLPAEPPVARKRRGTGRDRA